MKEWEEIACLRDSLVPKITQPSVNQPIKKALKTLSGGEHFPTFFNALLTKHRKKQNILLHW